MNAISLEARKRLLAEEISIIDDISVIEKIEKLLKNFSPSVKHFTIRELEERVSKSEQAIKDGRVYTTDRVRKRLEL